MMMILYYILFGLFTVLSVAPYGVVASDPVDYYGDTSSSTTNNNIHVMDSVETFQQTVLQSDAIWMVQLYDPQQHQKALPTLAPLYKQVGSIVKGLFYLAVVDVSTPHGQDIGQQYAKHVEQDLQKAPVLLLLSSEHKKTPEETLVATRDLKAETLLQALANAASNLILQRTGGGRVPKDEYQTQQPKQKAKEKSSSSGKRKTAYTKLRGSEYDEQVLNNPQVVLVAFTAPWCGHCKRLEPEFQQAGRALAGEEVLLAWVNAEDERELSSMYGVQGFPTLKLFAGGAPKAHQDAQDFPYERTKEGIVAGVLAEVERSGVPKEIPQLTSPQLLRDECQGSNHLCVLAALPDILDTGAAGRNKYRDLLTRVAKSFQGQMAFSFVWFEGGSQPGLESAFDLTFGFPALVAFSMDRQAFAVLRGSFTEPKITAFLHSLTTGRQATVKLNALPQVETVEPWDGKDGQVIEEEFDLSELFDDGEL